MGFFSRFFKRNACSIGIIGCADGPTSVFISKKGDSEDKHSAFLEYAAGRIKPSGHSFSEIENHLKEHYKAKPYQLSEGQRKLIKANVILNNFSDVLTFPPRPKRPSIRQIRRYIKNDTSHLQAMEYPEEKLGLDIKAYKIPWENTEVIVKLEMKSQYMAVQSDVDSKLNSELTMWLGVTEQDIKNKTPRFINYAYELKNSGKI